MTVAEVSEWIEWKGGWRNAVCAFFFRRRKASLGHSFSLTLILFLHPQESLIPIV